MSTQPFNPAGAATATAPTAVVATPLRTLEDLLGAARPPVRVDLLPREVVAARVLRRARRWLVAALVLVVAVLGGGVWLTSRSVAEAEAALATTQARTAVLSAEQAEYAEVPQVLGRLEAVRAARGGAMARDVLWYQYLDGFTRSLPEDVWLTGLTVTVADPAAPPATGPLATPGIGTAVFTGVAGQHSHVASWLESLAGTRGLADAAYSTSTRTALDGTTVVEFDSSTTVTDEALSHRFDEGDR